MSRHEGCRHPRRSPLPVERRAVPPPRGGGWGWRNHRKRLSSPGGAQHTVGVQPWALRRGGAMREQIQRQRYQGIKGLVHNHLGGWPMPCPDLPNQPATGPPPHPLSCGPCVRAKAQSALCSLHSQTWMVDAGFDAAKPERRPQGSHLVQAHPPTGRPRRNLRTRSTLFHKLKLKPRKARACPGSRLEPRPPGCPW